MADADDQIPCAPEPELTNVKSAETFLGILDYLGKIDNENCRAALKSAIMQMHDTLILGPAVANLLNHHYPEDVPFIMDRYFELGDRDQHYDTYLRNISWCLSQKLDSGYFERGNHVTWMTNFKYLA